MFERIRQFLRSLRSDEAEEVCRHLRRPANLSRRSFLRVLGVTSVTVAVGGWDKLLPQPCPFDFTSAAVAAINDFTRIKMREDGFFRRIMPPLMINDDIELDRCVETNGLLLPQRVPVSLLRRYVVGELIPVKFEAKKVRLSQTCDSGQFSSEIPC